MLRGEALSSSILHVGAVADLFSEVALRGQGTDTPAEKQEISPIVVIAGRLCCWATVELKYQMISRNIVQLVFDYTRQRVDTHRYLATQLL